MRSSIFSKYLLKILSAYFICNFVFFLKRGGGGGICGKGEVNIMRVKNTNVPIVSCQRWYFTYLFVLIVITNPYSCHLYGYRCIEYEIITIKFQPGFYGLNFFSVDFSSISGVPFAFHMGALLAAPACAASVSPIDSFNFTVVVFSLVETPPEWYLAICFTLFANWVRQMFESRIADAILANVTQIVSHTGKHSLARPERGGS